MRELNTIVTYLKVHRRAAIGTALAAAGVFVVTRPAFIEPVLTFFLAGAVPGTDIVLSPDTMMVGNLTVFGLGLVSLIVFWILRWRHGAAPVRAVHPAGTQPDISLRDKTEHLIYARKPAVEHRKKQGVMLNGLRSRMRKSSVFSRQIWLASRNIAISALAGAIRIASDVASILWKSLIVGAVFMQYIGAMARYYIRRSWRWLRPHLRRLDTWLERRFLYVSGRMSARMKQYESVQVGLEIIKMGKVSVKRLFNK